MDMSPIVTILRDGLTIYGGYRVLREAAKGTLAWVQHPPVLEFQEIPRLSEAYAGGDLANGALVSVPVRFSRYGYIYSPKSLYQADEHLRWSRIDDRSDPRTPRFFWGDSNTSEEHRGPVIVPPYPSGILPEIELAGKTTRVGFLYPMSSSGVDSYVTDSCRCIPVLYDESQDLDAYTDTIINIQARIVDLPDTLLQRLILNNEAAAKALLGFFYQPFAKIRKGFCLSMLDPEGRPDPAVSVDLALEVESVSVNFFVSWFIEGHLEGCDMERLDHAGRQGLYSDLDSFLLGTLPSDGILAPAGHVSRGHSWIAVDYKFLTPYYSLGFAGPNLVYCVACVDHASAYEEVLLELQRIWKITFEGMCEVSEKYAGTACTAQLDFLSDYRMQRAFSKHGALRSLAAKESIKGSADLAETGKWLTGAEGENSRRPRT